MFGRGMLSADGVSCSLSVAGSLRLGRVMVAQTTTRRQLNTSNYCTALSWATGKRRNQHHILPRNTLRGCS